MVGVVEAQQELDAFLEAMGSCGDGNCVVLKPEGMHTNGGCKCPRDFFRMQKYAYAHNRFADKIRAYTKEQAG